MCEYRISLRIKKYLFTFNISFHNSQYQYSYLYI